MIRGFRLHSTRTAVWLLLRYRLSDSDNPVLHGYIDFCLQTFGLQSFFACYAFFGMGGLHYAGNVYIYIPIDCGDNRTYSMHETVGKSGYLI